MKKRLLLIAPISLVAAVAIVAGAYLYSKQPQRSGAVTLERLEAPVTVRYDERGVPHLQAQSESDMYRALGYVHAQDRLFQMEMLRRLARGELAEVLGEDLLESDRLFRTLRIREQADAFVARQDRQSPAWLALLAYLEGINEFQRLRPAPLEFDLLGIPKRPFSPEDTASVAGYLAYSFAVGLRTEPVLTFIRDQLGSDYLNIFDLAWKAQGVLDRQVLQNSDWNRLEQIARISQQVLQRAALPQYDGSNAWVVAGKRTRSGKPLLAGDPHISFAVPAVWYEAHLSSPGLEIYGHHQALNPFAMLGHNQQAGWSITMFQNDDLDLIAERVNPDNPQQVWHQGQWVELESREELIAVKDGEAHKLTLKRSPNGPIINAALGPLAPGDTPIALWWAFLETDNPILNAFYRLNRASTPAQARQAAAGIDAPGLNVLWASASGDIAWWAAAKLPRRPAGVNPNFILDAATGEADKTGFYPFRDNPQEINPPRGYILSANHQPVAASGIRIPGYYNLADRARRIDLLLNNPSVKWDLQNSQVLQLDNASGYPQRVLQPLSDDLLAAASDDAQRQLAQKMIAWDGNHTLDSLEASLFNQFIYELGKAALQDELGEAFFGNLLRTRVLDSALPHLTADADSPWWDIRETAGREDRSSIVRVAWQASLAHLRSSFGDNPQDWSWGQTHSLTHMHPLGQRQPLDRLFNVGPFAVPGGHETPNNLSARIGPAPWRVVYGPSTRRLIDFANPEHSLGINPVGQSGVLLDRHYRDQAEAFSLGEYVPQHFNPEDVMANTRTTLRLLPAIN
jgi:penicillin amidase